MLQPPAARVGKNYYSSAVFKEHKGYFKKEMVKKESSIHNYQYTGSYRPPDKLQYCFDRSFQKNASERSEHHRKKFEAKTGRHASLHSVHDWLSVMGKHDKYATTGRAAEMAAVKLEKAFKNQKQWVSHQEKHMAQRRDRCIHLLSLFEEELRNDEKREIELMGLKGKQFGKRNREFVKERSETADRVMRIMIEYNFLPGVEIADYLKYTLDLARKVGVKVNLKKDGEAYKKKLTRRAEKGEKGGEGGAKKGKRKSSTSGGRKDSNGDEKGEKGERGEKETEKRDKKKNSEKDKSSKREDRTDDDGSDSDSGESVGSNSSWSSGSSGSSGSSWGSSSNSSSSSGGSNSTSSSKRERRRKMKRDKIKKEQEMEEKKKRGPTLNLGVAEYGGGGKKKNNKKKNVGQMVRKKKPTKRQMQILALAKQLNLHPNDPFVQTYFPHLPTGSVSASVKHASTHFTNAGYKQNIRKGDAQDEGRMPALLPVPDCYSTGPVATEAEKSYLAAKIMNDLRAKQVDSNTGSVKREAVPLYHRVSMDVGETYSSLVGRPFHFIDPKRTHKPTTTGNMF